MTLVAVLRYHAAPTSPPPPPPAAKGKDKDPEQKKHAMHGTFVVDEVRDPNTGEITKVNRMCGTGIFNDPNDFALILVTAIPHVPLLDHRSAQKDDAPVLAGPARSFRLRPDADRIRAAASSRSWPG